MFKKELIEYLKKNMPKFEGTEEEKEIKKALYIYIELGKMKSFDENYYFGNSKTRKKIYYLSQKQKENFDKTTKNKKITCITLTHLYCAVLKEFGIETIKSEPAGDDHIYPIITTKSKKHYMADLQADLENIQTKSELKYFKELTKEPIEYKKKKEELTQALIELKYIKSEKDYKDEAIEKIYDQVQDMNAEGALKNILEDESLYDGNENMGIIELYKFYKRTLKTVIPQFLDKKVFLFNCYKQKEDEKEYTLCAFSEENDKVNPYIFSKKNKKFLRVDLKTLKKLEEEGLVLGIRKKENGVRKLKKYIDKEIREEEKERI